MSKIRRGRAPESSMNCIPQYIEIKDISLSQCLRLVVLRKDKVIDPPMALLDIRSAEEAYLL